MRYNPVLNKADPTPRRRPSGRSRKRQAYTKKRNPYAAAKAQTPQQRDEQRQREAADRQQQRQSQISTSADLASHWISEAMIEANTLEREAVLENARVMFKGGSVQNITVDFIGAEKARIKGLGSYGQLQWLLGQAGISDSECWWMWRLMNQSEPGPDSPESVDAWTSPVRAAHVAASMATLANVYTQSPFAKAAAAANGDSYENRHHQ